MQSEKASISFAARLTGLLDLTCDRSRTQFSCQSWSDADSRQLNIAIAMVGPVAVFAFVEVLALTELVVLAAMLAPSPLWGAYLYLSVTIIEAWDCFPVLRRISPASH